MEETTVFVSVCELQVFQCMPKMQALRNFRWRSKIADEHDVEAQLTTRSMKSKYKKNHHEEEIEQIATRPMSAVPNRQQHGVEAPTQWVLGPGVIHTGLSPAYPHMLSGDPPFPPPGICPPPVLCTRPCRNNVARTGEGEG